MSTPSPGPGWWLASDGKWYPQRWEYNWAYYANESLETLVDKVGERMDTFGQQGWEMVNCSVQRTQTGVWGPNNRQTWTFEYSIVCFLKRPLAP